MFNAGARAADLAKSLAADSLTTNLMVADANLTIVYVNQALIAFLSAAEADIRPCSKRTLRENRASSTPLMPGVSTSSRERARAARPRSERHVSR